MDVLPNVYEGVIVSRVLVDKGNIDIASKMHHKWG